MDGQCDKLVTVVGHQFITQFNVDICVQRGGRKAPHRTGLSAAAEICCWSIKTCFACFLFQAEIQNSCSSSDNAK